MATSKKKEKTKDVKKKNIEKEERRVIKPKNYIILGIIFVGMAFAVFLLRYWYISYRDYQLTIPVLKGHLNEVTVAELDHYITANPDAIIYIEVSEDENSRSVAKDLIELVKERELTNRVVYLNLSHENDKNKFFEDFSNKYMENQELEKYPALILFIDGKVETFVSRTKKQRLNIGNIEQLFDQYELEGE